MSSKVDSNGAPVVAGHAFQIRRLTGAAAFAVKIPAKAKYVGVLSVENASAVQLDSPNSQGGAALVTTHSAPLAAGGSFAAGPVNGGEWLRFAGDEGSTGAVVLYIEGSEIPNVLTVVEPD